MSSMSLWARAGSLAAAKANVWLWLSLAKTPSALKMPDFRDRNTMAKTTFNDNGSTGKVSFLSENTLSRRLSNAQSVSTPRLHQILAPFTIRHRIGKHRLAPSDPGAFAPEKTASDFSS